MPRRTKVLVIAAMLLVGAIAAVAFRKTSTPEPESTADATATPAARPELPPLAVEKPAPVSHLTGRIESADRAGSRRPCVARGPASAFQRHRLG